MTTHPPTTKGSRAAEHTVRIENPGRVQRILARICAANLNVVIRAHNDPSIAVKGRASSITEAGGSSGVKILGLSAPGEQHLRSATTVRIEFKGMSTQVAFDARILQLAGGAITVTLPRTIFSTERRQGARFHTTSEHSAFIDLSVMNGRAAIPAEFDPPLLSISKELSTWYRIQDISEGGLCAVSRFPAILTCVQPGSVDEKAHVMLPMSIPIHVRLETRWIKRIKERTNADAERYSRRALIGFEFKNPSEDLILRIRQFVRAMNLSNAI